MQALYNQRWSWGHSEGSLFTVLLVRERPLQAHKLWCTFLTSCSTADPPPKPRSIANPTSSLLAGGLLVAGS